MDSRIVATRWMNEVWRARRVEAIETLHATHFVDHSPAPGQSNDLAAYISGVHAFFATFPDFKATTEALIVEGEHVAVRWRGSGIQRETFLGFPASGQRIHFHGIEILHIQEGRIVARWGEWDALSLIEQLRAGVESRDDA